MNVIDRQKILVVDDDELIRDICLLALADEGYRVEGAVNGNDALKKLGHSTYDLVVTDINMPVMDGISLYVYSLRDYPDLFNKFLFMSGNPHHEGWPQSKLAEMGMTIIKKPFTMEDFLSHIKKLLC